MALVEPGSACVAWLLMERVISDLTRCVTGDIGSGNHQRVSHA